jgi:hypothetical protein
VNGTAVDRLLEMLRSADLPYRWHPTQLSRWDSTCPACVTGEWNLTVIDHGPTVTLRCRNGCREREIVKALRERPALLVAQEREQVALELAEAVSSLAHRALDLAREGTAV